jgi:hypothetical protein
VAVLSALRDNFTAEMRRTQSLRRESLTAKTQRREERYYRRDAESAAFSQRELLFRAKREILYFLSPLKQPVIPNKVRKLVFVDTQTPKKVRKHVFYACRALLFSIDLVFLIQNSK